MILLKLRSFAFSFFIFLILSTSVQAQTMPQIQISQDPSRIHNVEEAPVPQIRNNQATTANEDTQTPQPPVPSAENLKPEPLTEFQVFVRASSGQTLEIFGRDLFNNVPSTFAPANRVAAPSDYVIGPGDEIQLRAWGQLDMDYHVTVDRMGNIFIPKIGTITVANIKYDQLQSLLKASISKVFKDFDLTVNLGQLRSIPIFVVGHVRRPGSYTVSALSTVVNAIFASGGPASGGSMRHIQLKRGSKVISEFDLYDLLLKGDKSKDVTLLPGDVIYVPAVGPLVAVLGSVNAPAIYEINRGTSLEGVLSAAGGLTPTAAGQKVTIERIEDRSSRKVQEISLDKQGLGFGLDDGDVITVRALTARFDNAVTLRGNVTAPGRYPWHAGMHVSDLIPTREALIPRKYWDSLRDLGMDTGGVFKAKPRKENSEPSDNNTDKTGKEPTKEKETTPENLQQANNDKTPMQADASPRNRAADVLEKRLPDINWDYALVQRFDKEKLTNSLFPFNLGEAIAHPDGPQNLLLEPGDSVTIFTVADIQVKHSEQVRFVRLDGEFGSAGVYQVAPHESLRELIQRVGGITPAAYLYGLEFTRESARRVQQERYDQFLLGLERDIEAEGAKSANVLSVEEAAGLRDKIDQDRKMLEKLRTLRPTGRVVFGIKPSQTGLDAIPEIAPEDGDRLVLPYRPDTVNVIGAVYNESSYLYKDRHKVSYYLRLAGGTTRQSDSGHMFIIRADGSVISKDRNSGFFTRSFESIELMPGDTIVLPQKLGGGSFIKGLRDWSQILSQFGLGAAAITTLTH